MPTTTNVDLKNSKKQKAAIFFSTILLKKLSLGTLPTVTEMAKKQFWSDQFWNPKIFIDIFLPIFAKHTWKVRLKCQPKKVFEKKRKSKLWHKKTKTSFCEQNHKRNKIRQRYVELIWTAVGAEIEN